MPSSQKAASGPYLAFAVIAGSVVANIYFFQPILPLIASDLGAPEASIGLIPGFTLAGFACGLAMLVPLGDSVQRKTLVLIQIALAAVFALAFGLAPNFPALLAAAFGLGVVSCVPQQLTPFAAALAPPEMRGRAVGIVVSGIMIGLLAGRTVGGALSAVIGWRDVFVIDSAFMVVLLAVAWRVLPSVKPATDLSYGRLLASLPGLVIRHPLLRRAMATQALAWIAFNAFWASLASLLAQSYGLGSFWAGAFGLVGLVGALAASAGGRASDRLGSKRVLYFSFVMIALSYVVMFAAPASMLALVVGVIVLDLGCQSALVANQTRIFALDPHAQGRLNTLYMVASFVGGAIGAALSGYCMARWGWNGVATLGLAAGLAALGLHALPVSASRTSAR
jgi:predicted MFS family arabinose efflux permease